jgi:hypothetical protein
MVVVIIDSGAILALWQGQTQKPNYDHIAVALSAFQVTFAIAAVYGFWALRGFVKETAQEVAEKEVEKDLPSMVARQVDAVLAAKSGLSTMPGSAPISDSDVSEIVRAFGEQE